ncbi:MAG: hypothetical protein Q9160_005313 [Pyrenula sp. 1 TL-2023]
MSMSILLSTPDLLTSLISSLASLPPPPHSADQPTHLHDFHPTNPLSLLNLNLTSKFPSPSTLSAKDLLITLHFLFPHEVLPALDLLDRKLVNHFIIVSPFSQTGASLNPPSSPDIPAPDTEPAKPGTEDNDDGDGGNGATAVDEIFYVQSASAVLNTNSKSKRRPRAYNPVGTHYEVRLRAWNCGCPAFANLVLSSLFDRSQGFDGGDGAGGPDDGGGDEAGGAGVDGSEFNAVAAATVQQFGGSLTHEASGSGSGSGNGIPVCKHILAAYLGSQVPGMFGQGVVMKRVSREEAAGWAGGWGD